jgi:two-component system, chemotaxis family, protein-glutamate methylesterase/glutaminase
MMFTARIKTLLIDDSAFMRKIISDIITHDKTLELVGTAVNGKEGFEMVRMLNPDVIVTDMVMPEYDGMYVVRQVMESKPIPIILLSALEKTNPRIFDALQGGAFEFIDKPQELDEASIKNYRLLDLIKAASRADIQKLQSKLRNQKNCNAHTFSENARYDIVVIGASTGGPGALESIINNLPTNLTIPVVIAQHMPARFLETFADRLNANSLFQVKLAHKGEVLQNGKVYIAPGDNNLKVEISVATGKPMFTYTNTTFSEFNFPSVDCLFESVANTYGSRCIGVILTGMGRDGAKGLLQIKQSGGVTIAQDEQTSVVYGMPKAACDDGAVLHTVRLKDIPGFIISCL